MNTENFTIDTEDIELAQSICELITDLDVRNRAVANAMAARIAAKYFDPEIFNVDADSGLHNIGKVLQDIDISDIYINNSYIDVRVFFSDEEISIPSENVANNLIPTAYMFIKLTPDISGATVVGFIRPENINKNNLVEGYYKIDESELEAFYDIESLLKNYDDGDNVNEIEDKEIFAYLDNTLENKVSFFSSLLKSRDARLKLAKAAKAQIVFSYISVQPEFYQKTVPNKELDLSDNTNTEELSFSDLSSDILTDKDEINDDLELESDNIAEQEDPDNNEIYHAILADSETEMPLGVAQNESITGTNNNIEDDSTQSVIEDDNPDLLSNNSSDGQFSYSTQTSPSISELDDEALDNYEQFVNKKINDSTNNEHDQIDTLFNTELEENSENSGEIRSYQKKQTGSSVFKPLFIIIILIAAGTIGYISYSKFILNPSNDDSLNSTVSDTIVEDGVNDAMPIESVDATDMEQKNQNESTSTSIPAIEQNLDASILVSNLSVDWEVPAGYASNTSAKRYLVKLGKIIQLNLKTELLLLNKPPITNKIGVEIKFNNNSKKFEATGVTISSGEKTVDDLILQTVNKALKMNISINTDSFSKLQGNPVLIIHL